MLHIYCPFEASKAIKEARYQLLSVYFPNMIDIWPSPGGTLENTMCIDTWCRYHQYLHDYLLFLFLIC